MFWGFVISLFGLIVLVDIEILMINELMNKLLDFIWRSNIEWVSLIILIGLIFDLVGLIKIAQ